MRDALEGKDETQSSGQERIWHDAPLLTIVVSTASAFVDEQSTLDCFELLVNTGVNVNIVAYRQYTSADDILGGRREWL